MHPDTRGRKAEQSSLINPPATVKSQLQNLRCDARRHVVLSLVIWIAESRAPISWDGNKMPAARFATRSQLRTSAFYFRTASGTRPLFSVRRVVRWGQRFHIAAFLFTTQPTLSQRDRIELRHDEEKK
jgi:hypothetical protein